MAPEKRDMLFRVTRLRLSLAGLLLSALSVCGAAQAAPSPLAAKAFLVKVYAGQIHYDTHDGAAAVFDPSTVALFRLDAKLTPPHKVGAIDFDPICWCQDSKDLSFAVQTIAITSPSTATASVTSSYPGRVVARMRVQLTLTAAGWRIHDIVESDAGKSSTSSLRALLNRGIHQMGG